jgi:hypothetical protein
MNVPLEGLLPTTPVLTIEEAAGVLRISRTLAYELANQYRKSGGTSGLPCTRIAGCLRVPRWALLSGQSSTGSVSDSIRPIRRSANSVGNPIKYDENLTGNTAASAGSRPKSSTSKPNANGSRPNAPTLRWS